jgi:hypothetical protein
LSPLVNRSCDQSADADLEVRIDDRTRPARIRLAGVLDWSTQRSFFSAVERLFVVGAVNCVVDAGGLGIGDAWGASALILFHQRLRDEGGSLVWAGFDSDRAGQGASQEPSCSWIRHGTELVFVPVIRDPRWSS